MGQFSQTMRGVAKDLCRKLGNKCTLSKETPSKYDPTTGETASTGTISVPTYSAPKKKFSLDFGMTGENTNLSGFDDETVIVPWFGHVIDKTWLYNGQNILSVSSITSQDEIIIFEVRVGEKV